MGILFLSSCFDRDNRGAMPGKPFMRIDIAAIEAVDSLTAEDVLEDHHIIKLETDSNSLIGEIHKILFEADRFFVLDILVAKNIFVFDNSGRHLYNVGHMGQGPGEYMQPKDIAIDTARKELIVYDEGSLKLLVYDLLGKFKREHRINLRFGSMEYINGDTILGLAYRVLNVGNDQKEYPYDLLVFDTDGAIREKYLFNGTEMGKSSSFLTGNKYFSKNDSTIFLSCLLIDTVYTLEEDYRPVPRYVLDFGNKRVQKKDLDDVDKLMDQLVAGEKWGIWDHVLVTNQNMLLTFTQRINQGNLEGLHRILVRFPDSYTRFRGISFKDLSWSFPVATRGEYFVSPIPPQKIGKRLTDELGLHEQDNPVLLFYKFKQSD